MRSKILPIVFRIAGFCFLIFTLASGCDSNASVEEEPEQEIVDESALNLSFEQVGSGSKPDLWYTGGDGYEVITDGAVFQDGERSLRIRFQGGIGFGVATQTFPLQDGLGKSLTFRGYIRTEGISNGYAGLWMRIDGPNQTMIGFDNMSGRGVTGTTEWTQYEIELEAGLSAENIVFGALHNGNGTAWFDAFSFLVDGESYTPTPPTEIDDAQLQWLTNTAYSFDTDVPGQGFSDLEFLSDMVGSSHIVSLGEGTHGTREFFRMKHRIVEYLATEMGFTIFAIEANMPESRAINRYVLYGEGNAREALQGIYFWTWNTEEVLAMIEWMRSYNASGMGQIQFMGFDMQTPTVAMDNVEAFVAEVDSSSLSLIHAFYTDIRRVYEDLQRSNQDSSIGVDYNLWRSNAQAVLSLLTENQEAYRLSRDNSEVDWLIQDARVVLQSASSDSRDLYMAENVNWIVDHSPANSKIVLWAHNGHVKRSTSGFVSMGSYLDQRHREDMIVFGFGFHEGQYTAVGDQGLGTYSTSISRPGTAEWEFHRTGLPRFMLDLRLASSSDSNSSWLTDPILFRSIGAMAISDAFSTRVLTDDFDVLIFFDQTQPSVLLR